MNILLGSRARKIKSISTSVYNYRSDMSVLRKRTLNSSFEYYKEYCLTMRRLLEEERLYDILRKEYAFAALNKLFNVVLSGSTFYEKDPLVMEIKEAINGCKLTFSEKIMLKSFGSLFLRSMLFRLKSIMRHLNLWQIRKVLRRIRPNS